jgi:hypothetical protein
MVLNANRPGGSGARAGSSPRRAARRRSFLDRRGNARGAGPFPAQRRRDQAQCFDALAALLLQHKVLFLPDQPIDRDQHKRFAAYFGEVTKKIGAFLGDLASADPNDLYE